MNHAYHETATAAVMAEALVARGVDKAEAARIAILVARSNAMVDYCKPENLRPPKSGEPLPVVTQLGTKSAARTVNQDWWWAGYERCHRWHFDPANGWPRLKVWSLLGDPVAVEPAGWMAFGAHLHTAQDTDGPHAGFVGYPSPVNYERTEHVKGLAWWTKAARWLLRRDKDEVIGHVLAPDIDRIENCREGALASAVRLFELVSGRQTDRLHIFGYGGEAIPKSVESLVAIRDARNDADLAARCREVFKQATGQELPEFQAFTGPELEAWYNTVRGG